MRVYLTAGLVIGVVGLSAAAWSVAQSETGNREVSPFQRRVAPQGERASEASSNSSRLGLGGPVSAAQFPLEYRSIDGHGNNPFDPEKGAAGTPFVRQVASAYTDKGGAGDLPARADGPSPRAISNVMCPQAFDMPNPEGISDYLWQWGQFLDHDIAETPLASPSEPLDIPIPLGDASFDPFMTGTQTMGMDRSSYAMVDGVRQQLNLITAFVDASNVYGSETKRTHELRTNDGTGRLKTSEGNLLPFNEEGLPNAGGTDSTLFLAGDVRVNEQTGLCAMHTLFVREHNYWADAFRARNPEFTGDEVFEHARAIVAAEMQAITYNEFLPLLIGDNAMPAYDGYKADVEPGISNVFAAAGYRVGHTMLSSRLMRLDSSMQEAPEGHLALRDAFFRPDTISDNGITSVLRGLAGQRSQTIDAIVVDDVRNFLFGPPGAGGFDLASLNIQRGRDHGLGSYNDVREAFGMAKAMSFAEINSDPSVSDALASVYNSVDDVDPWVGLLAEPHVAGAVVGETLQAVLADQFARLRDGDRFWYTEYLPRHLSQMVDRQTLGSIIRRNTDAGVELSRDVFKVADVLDADWNGDEVIDINDVHAFLSDWHAGNADVNGDGASDIDDILSFLEVWGASAG